MRAFWIEYFEESLKLFCNISMIFEFEVFSLILVHINGTKMSYVISTYMFNDFMKDGFLIKINICIKLYSDMQPPVHFRP